MSGDTDAIRAALNVGRFEIAEKLCRERLSEETYSGEILIPLGEAVAGQGRHKEALTILKQVVGPSPYLFAARLYIASISLSLGGPIHRREASKALDSALELNPESSEAKYYMAELEIAAGRNAEALRWIDQALKDNPTDTESLATRAKVLFLLGRKTEAIATNRMAMRESPDDATSHVMQALLHYDRGDYPAAALASREALRLSPGHPAACTLLADATRRQYILYRVLMSPGHMPANLYWVLLIGMIVTGLIWIMLLWLMMLYMVKWPIERKMRRDPMLADAMRVEKAVG